MHAVSELIITLDSHVSSAEDILPNNSIPFAQYPRIVGCLPSVES